MGWGEKEKREKIKKNKGTVIIKYNILN